MTNPADVFDDRRDVTARSRRTFPPPSLETIGWGLLLAQIITVGFVYFFGSALPALPSLFEYAASGAEGEPELSSFVTWSTVVVGMTLGLIVAFLWLRREGRVLEAWTLTAPPSGWGKTLALAAVATAVIFLIFGLVGAAVEAIGLGMPDASLVLNMVIESPMMFALWVVGVAWLAAGTGEELLYRGFLMDRLARVSGLRGKPWLVIVIQAVLFGLPHAYQGWGGVVVTGTVGLFLGWLRMQQKGNLWACIIAHAAVDTIAMALFYADAMGWFAV
ncbi:CPBP family intramembrane glutamic endopeptidase [Aurantiacibacter sediminis]|uniref:CPBP family intramembrane metalloprotease n=1 Tax=Aurantiacibacter sediminis TaxID=2793064 RepID=A0ABS0N393_9SPHN|nr:CPBP family intramembrane glutamic endopeptidase [Aurantiacibacter sediminis]MBH5321745.1 CPBP family intramembrane metalloprotease [Aurantiacibacter sediminis]